MQLTTRQQNIITIVENQLKVSISQIKSELQEEISMPTLNREMASLVSKNYLLKIGQGRSTAYQIAPTYRLLNPIVLSDYFEEDPDTRKAITIFNPNLFPVLEEVDILFPEEKKYLNTLQQNYQDNRNSLSPVLYRKELERLTIELSWKSSQIEGNTYSLLETERLFLEKEEAAEKPHEDAVMLLNHKYALNYLLENRDIGKIVDLRLLEDVHTLLIKDLGVSRNIRSRPVGITGTSYKPIDNKFQIREAIEKMCTLINRKENIFEKALLAVVLISYIQPFEDGNKRTGRMVSNALLIAGGACPLSYRSIDSLEYKKAMLLFYEQNSLFAFKKIFIEQNEFSVKNYFS
ncbi:MAG: Fic family protein [Pseudomonadota bacterium]